MADTTGMFIKAGRAPRVGLDRCECGCKYWTPAGRCEDCDDEFYRPRYLDEFADAEVGDHLVGTNKYTGKRQGIIVTDTVAGLDVLLGRKMRVDGTPMPQRTDWQWRHMEAVERVATS